MALVRLRAALGLEIKRPLFFLSQCNAIYTGLDENKSLFVAPNPALPVVLGQIQAATAAQQLMGTAKAVGAARDASFSALRTSMESERAMVQGLCDASPEQAAALIAAASMKAVALGAHPKPLLALANGLPSGTVLLVANATLLDGTTRRKMFNWESTSDGGRTFSPMPSTPIGKTSIANLVPLTMVGFRVSVTVANQPQGAWSQVVTILVR
jgi:hypothetical protein